ncbi:aldolase [Natronomonas salina]|uniref:HpcH/HpaI aldolase family protein n=1 Tax=Natronomonas salina TaxID=1710540 RepID=UPI0015B4F68D|nr:aldolase/citrate lyase family protein [Natronomonas salina]QLD88045.1 aldolase [Natronomonas salina]
MTSELQQNRLRRTVENGDVAFGVIDGVYSPKLVELVGGMGFDFVWIDLEHGGPSPMDGERLEDLLRAADAVDTELLVRVPSSDPATVRKVLDVGARNVFVSRVETAEEVRTAVEAARFEYDDGPGRRGLAAPRASRWGGAGDSYPATEDEEVLVGVTVETERAVENIEEIVSVPELGFVFVGPNDLSVSMGRPGEVDADPVEEAVETVRTTGLENDVAVGGLTFGMDDVRAKVDDGYQLLNVGSTTGAVSKQLGSWHEQYEDAGN